MTSYAGPRETLKSGLPAFSFYAALLAAAGLPIYIHAPKVYVDRYGVSLAALGSVLFLLRLLDVVQDPLFGRLSERLRHHRGTVTGIATVLMALGMLALFAVTPPVHPLVWFALALAVVFSSYSLLTINFYAQGVAKAASLGANGHLKVARWRETGALLGVALAAMAPSVLAPLTDRPFAGYALGFAVAAALALYAMRDAWTSGGLQATTGFGPILRDATLLRLLVIALLNAAPLAVTSTLFLFFVDARLGAPELDGVLLLLFFLSAAAGAPLWSVLAERVGTKPVLVAAMLLAIITFAGAFFLREGDVLWFALVCFGSGLATGADLTLLPAIFARRLEVVSPSGAAGFGLWSFMSKFTLAFAAVVLLPALQFGGFDADGVNDESALWLLSLLYAGVPCVLKLAAIALVATTDLKET